jgi:hypothetical protein
VSARTPERLGLRAAPWLLWFGVLGGAVAWSLHTVVDWGLEETVCRAGNDEVLGLPLRPLLFVLSVVFLALSIVSTVVAYGLWRKLVGASVHDDLDAVRNQRATFMAVVGLAADVLFTLMIAMGTAAVVVIPVCTS